ncbi:hypothetical protein WR25_19927 [Diploscapter pachys]|uniref:Nas2 N-terminal domain-containing protein n=1 Tax=Diploscapter pachys TaxID=2018661 RepID=A0A2A2LXT0_9BILA|nr:hypothetical protein WR25_19927 [Diploscapter pachys]
MTSEMESHRLKANELKSKLEEMDKELADNWQYLRKLGFDLDTPVIDENGFPRADIDISAVNNAKRRIREIEKDSKEVQDKLAETLDEMHQTAAKNGQVDSPTGDSSTGNRPIVHRTSNTPFVKIAAIASGSPGEKAGAQKGDEIIQFGSLFHGIVPNLNTLRDYLVENENAELRVTVLRNIRPVHYLITPAKWNGVGLTGIQFELINQPS